MATRTKAEMKTDLASGTTLTQQKAHDLVDSVKWHDEGYGAYKLFDQTLAANGTFDFDNIPQGYDYLELLLTGRTAGTDAGVGAENVRLIANADTTLTNYRGAEDYAGGSNGGVAYDNNFIGAVANDTTNAGYVGALKATLYNYASTTQFKAATAEVASIRGPTSSYVQGIMWNWENVAAITRLQLVPQLSGVFLAGSRLIVLGYK